MPNPIDTEPAPESLVSETTSVTTAPSAPEPTPVVAPVAGSPAAEPAPSSTPAAGTSPEPATPAAVEVDPWKQELGQWGIDYSKFQGPEQAVAFALQSAQAIAEQTRREREEYERRIQQYSQPAPAPVAAPQPEAKEGPWNPPEFDTRWSKALQYNPETGLYEAINPAVVPQDIVTKANARAEWERKWQSEFANNPFEFMKKGLEEQFKSVEERAFERAIKYIEQQKQEQFIDSTVQATVEKHSEWLYQKGVDGSVLIDAGGRRVLSPKGASYYKAVEELRMAGVSDPRMQDYMALRMIGNQSQPTPAARVQQFAGQPAAKNLAEALHTSTAGGALKPTVPGAVGPSPVEESFLAMAREAMAERGIQLTGGVVSTLN